jgi:hypothetical protein
LFVKAFVVSRAPSLGSAKETGNAMRLQECAGVLGRIVSKA